MYKHPVYSNYTVDAEGNVYGKQGVRKTCEVTNGYVGIGVSKEGKPKTYRLHRFIWESINGMIPEGLQINHIDGNKRNNKPDNLELCTARENVINAFKLGLSKGPRGEKNGKSKLTESKVIEILQHLKDGKTKTLIANMYSISRATVRMIGQGKRWGHVKLEVK